MSETSEPTPEERIHALLDELEQCFFDMLSLGTFHDSEYLEIQLRIGVLRDYIP